VSGFTNRYRDRSAVLGVPRGPYEWIFVVFQALEAKLLQAAHKPPSAAPWRSSRQLPSLVPGNKLPCPSLSLPIAQSYGSASSNCRAISTIVWCCSRLLASGSVCTGLPRPKSSMGLPARLDSRSVTAKNCQKVCFKFSQGSGLFLLQRALFMESIAHWRLKYIAQGRVHICLKTSTEARL
jgi:hypothetical protein